MTTLNSLSFAVALALGLAATSVQAEAVRSVAGEPAWPTKAAAAVTWRLAQAPAGSTTRIDLPALDLVRVAELQKRNARRDNIATQIGVGRDITDASVQAKLGRLRWTPVDGGAVARFEVDSPDALGLRAGLKLVSLPQGVELRFAGSLAPERVVLVPAEEAKSLANAGLYWSPVTDGGRQTIEIFAPTGVDTGSVRLELPHVSHLLTNSIEQFSLAKIGESGACNVDTVCRVGALGQNFVNAKNAVARMSFTEGLETYTCTGTLLNDTDNGTQIPYFYSADHCISTQAVANTLNTYWGYEATTCGGLTAAANVQLTGGADYLYSQDGSSGTDGLLLRLRGTPPAGAYFAGWDANQVTDGTEVLAIHHPAGDAKMSSIGEKITQDSVNIEVGWTSGTTEGGSSGSGLFTSSSSGYALRGGLFGGYASCANTGNLDNTDNRDWYSRLDVMYPHIQQYLAPGGGGTDPLPTRQYTGAWYVPGEDGWGLTALQFNNAQQNLFVLFFIYDSTGKAQWYELGGGWSATDVRSGNVLQSTANQPWGPTFGGRNFTTVGTGSLTFTSATSANLTFTVNGVTRSVTLAKL